MGYANCFAFFFATMLGNSPRLHVIFVLSLAVLVSREPRVFFCFVNEGQQIANVELCKSSFHLISMKSALLLSKNKCDEHVSFETTNITASISNSNRCLTVLTISNFDRVSCVTPVNRHFCFCLRHLSVSRSFMWEYSNAHMFDGQAI